MTTMDHIHLDIYDETGVRYDNDGAPLMRWTVTQRAKIPQVQLNIARSVTGVTHASRVVNALGQPIQHTDWRFTLRVSAAELDDLITLNGKLCDFIDNEHVLDGEDHEPFIQRVTARAVTDLSNLEPMLNKYNVTVELIDMEGHGYDTL